MGNRLEVPPSEIVEKGTAEVLSFLRQLAKGSGKRAIAKLMFIGPGGVGKSSLFAALRSGERVAEGSTETTVGIDVGFLEWPVDVGGGDVPLTFRVFDCAGQEQYGMMQRLFFTVDQCLYILVVDLSAEIDVGILKDRLDSIQAVAPGATFILVGTKRDKAVGEADQTLAALHDSLLTSLKRDADLVVESEEYDDLGYVQQPPELLSQYFCVSSTEYHAVAALQQALVKLVRGNRSRFERVLPRSWVGLFEKIAEFQRSLDGKANKGVKGEGQEPVLESGALLEARKDRVWERVEAAELGFQSVTEFEEALSYWSALGYVLWFSEVRELKEVVFLQPSWLALVLGSIFSHTLDDKTLWKPHLMEKVKDLTKRGLLHKELIPELPKLRERNREIDVPRLLQILEHFELAYSIQGEYFLPGLWTEGRPPDVESWSSESGGTVFRGWRLMSTGRLPAGFFETVLVRSGVCTAYPHQQRWRRGALMLLSDGGSLLVESRTRRDGGVDFDILAKANAPTGVGDDTNRLLWERLSPVITSVYNAHMVDFRGYQRLQYSAACPNHYPNHFLPMTPEVLKQVMSGGFSAGDLEASCGAPGVNLEFVPYLKIAPAVADLKSASGELKNTIFKLEVKAGLQRIERAQKVFPELIEKAQHALGRLIVEVERNRAPRVFVIQRHGDTSATARSIMENISEEVGKAAVKVVKGTSSAEDQARLAFSVVYNGFVQKLFRHDATLYLCCEECFALQGSGYKIQMSKWAERLAAGLGVLLLLGKLGSLCAPMAGLDKVADGLVKAIEALKAPLQQPNTALPTAAEGASRDLHHVSKEGLEAAELLQFLQENDKDKGWTKLLTLYEAHACAVPDSGPSASSAPTAPNAVQGSPATVWICQKCVEKRLPVHAAPRGFPGEPGPEKDDGEPAANNSSGTSGSSWKRCFRCCGGDVV
ncbi:leucine-rich repeat kinase 2 [Klebsormidium nitens]|uniref:Leucine-rich repeat kinase 2 n=1 Tax=Klebsormidium nitens TaxID=105231 RepID=A0A1Y1IGL0_KLENI|nr:leucine-rich repeat kinase 2 [Klebsormidium nitens]|eukprot:GAQ89985.1 leucine-rich repeat kinase 2 [Klebsormidium nitens]